MKEWLTPWRRHVVVYMREKTEKLSADGAWDWMLCVFGWTQYRRGVAREMSQGTINANHIKRGGSG